MFNIKNITANLIATTIVASGIANFSIGMTWAKDAAKSENDGGRGSGRGRIYSQKDANSVITHTRASCQDLCSNPDYVKPELGYVRGLLVSTSLLTAAR